MDMKRILFAVMAAAAAFAMTSCDPQESTVSSIAVNAIIDESQIQEMNLNVDSYPVTFTNVNTGLTVTVDSENGIATATELVPGLYNVTTNLTVNGGNSNYILSGSATNVNLATDGQEVSLVIAATKEAGLIFKEIYYTGCMYSTSTGTSTYIRDQFYEIYNNSAETIYVDGLCIAETWYQSTAGVPWTYPIENQENYVFTQMVWQIPGEGTTYPVAPGESIVIAQWGTNHKAENLTNGGSPVDLSGAEFEAIESSSVVGGITITDGPAINMIKAVNTKGNDGLPQWLTSLSGSRYIIFSPSESLRQSDYLVATNDESSGGNSIALEIPISEIIDAVQAVSGQADMNNLGLPPVLDAGAIWCTDGQMFTGQSISRKILRTESDGRVVYQDTNNTTEDFEVNDTPQIRRNGAGVPSWNTWYTAE